MSTWFSLTLGDALVAWEPLGRIEQLYASADASAGNAEERAVFTRYDSEGRLHCQVTAYFPPAMADVARQVGATPCEKPSREGLSLLAGAEESWLRLFSDR